MFEIFSKTPDLLLPGQHVKFEAAEEDFSPEIPADTYYTIARTNQIPFARSFIIPSGETKTVPADNNASITEYLNIYPENSYTLYEILIGLKGSDGMLVYPVIPADSFMSKLESTHLNVSTGNSIKRQISPIEVEDTPSDAPKAMLYTTKDMETFYFKLYNNGSKDGKIVFEFLINRCYIDRVTKPPERYKVIQSYDMMYGFYR